MTISVWRYSHLALAVSSFLFVALASVTGVILAFEPISQQVQPYRASNFSELTLANVVPVVQEHYSDITELTIDDNRFVVINASDSTGDQVMAYIDPNNGKQLGLQTKQSPFFQWVTNLHRSLFLKETGRIFVGFISFLLFLISLSGSILVIQRQRGVKRFFSKVVKDHPAQFFHVVLGRLTLIPIIIISLSGALLTLFKIGLLDEPKISHDVDFESIKTSPSKKTADFEFFKTTLLSEVQSVEFPFSPDPEDYFTIKLNDRELTLNQVTGEILTEHFYAKTTLANRLSLNLHTGRTNLIWAIILAIASANILYFIYSGFVIMWKRRSGRVKNKYKAEDSRFIILVGSENGNTFRFAKAVYNQIVAAGESCFLTELNRFTHFPKAGHLIILTSTYGLGDAPTNANRFAQLLKSFPQPQGMRFSVVGFGSHSYPDYCQFAYEVNNLLERQPWAMPLTDIHTINDRSPEEFSLWAKVWSQQTGINLDVQAHDLLHPPQKLDSFTVLSNLSDGAEEPVFSLSLQPQADTQFQSGDLLAIYPANDHRERLYSIGKVNNLIQLSVRLHPQGLGSPMLFGLHQGQVFNGSIIANAHFHFPAEAPLVIMVCNGTGIAPFLGMISQNQSKLPIRLYAGFRNRKSFGLYEPLLTQALQTNNLGQMNIAYSREGEKQYVNHLLQNDGENIARLLTEKGVIMLCGSLSMQKDVLEILDQISMQYNSQPVSFYQSHGQIRMDCY